MPKKKTDKSDRLKLDIEYDIPEDFVTRFATNMVIQIIENAMESSYFT